MSIPKIIHYCWFGGNPLDDMAKKCIESWKRHCPDYEIKEWNESNFDVNSNIYVKEAYGAKKWAFVSDYVRLFALKEHGGIYMDTDMELLKKIDSFLDLPAFSGFENDNSIPTAIMGSEKDGEWISYLLSYYDDRHFVLADGRLDVTTNVTTITNMTQKKYSIALNNTYQLLDGVLALYPRDYFCPKNYETGKLETTKNTVCIHHFNGSWHSAFEDKLKKKHIYLTNKYGEVDGIRRYVKWLKRNKIIFYIRKNGFKNAVKRAKMKILNIVKRA